MKKALSIALAAIFAFSTATTLIGCGAQKPSDNNPVVQDDALVTIMAGGTEIASGTTTGASSVTITPVAGATITVTKDGTEVSGTTFTAAGTYTITAVKDGVTKTYTFTIRSGGGSSGKTTVIMGGWSLGDVMTETYATIVSEFNRTYGRARNIELKFTPQSTMASYWSAAQGKLGPSATEPFDIYMTDDRTFKTWVQSYGSELRNIGYLTDEPNFRQQLSAVWTGMIDRFRLNINGWTSYEDDDLWAVPIDANPTALYYNRTVLENNGIIVISVEDETVTEDNYDELCQFYAGLSELNRSEWEGKNLLDLWNDGLIQDMFGSSHDNLKFVSEKNPGEGINYYYRYSDAKIQSDILEQRGVTVPAKGFYRSVSPRNAYYEGADLEYLNNDFIAPDQGSDPEDDEILVFNASIAMSWNEIEDVAMMCSKKFNVNSASTDGYFTQWWFNYGWSVGGDCIEDTTGFGTWTFSLSDYTKNYKVLKDGYVGLYTGKEYKEGETLQWLDKLDVTKLVIEPKNGVYTATSGSIVVPDPDVPGAYIKVDAATGDVSSVGSGNKVDRGSTDDGINPLVKEVATDNLANRTDEQVLLELPSTKEAFTRFCHLVPNQMDEDTVGGQSALDHVGGVSYLPDTAQTSEARDVYALAHNEVAFVVERGDKLGDIRKAAGGMVSWGIANLPIYKEYLNPDDPDDVTIKSMGVQAGHSECTALGITLGCATNEVQAAWEIIQWMASDYYYIDGDTPYFGPQAKEFAHGADLDEFFGAAGNTKGFGAQYIRAKNGYIPNQETLFKGTEITEKTFIKPSEKNLNLKLFAYAIEYEKAGDWWYLPNGSSTWIKEWANPLNNEVRAGELTVAELFANYTRPSNQQLHNTFNYYYGIDTNLLQEWVRRYGDRV
jgi:hypothetical protein